MKEEKMTEEKKAGALTTYARSSDIVASMSKADMAKALATTKDDTSSGGGGGEFVSFSGKTGKAVIGRDKEDAIGMTFIVDVPSLFSGWVLWKRSKPVSKHRWSSFEPHKAILESDLADPGELSAGSGDGWHKLSGMVLIVCDDVDDDKTKPVIFETNSASGRNAFGDLLDEISKRLASGEPEYPVFTLGAEAFTAQDQKNYKPVLAVETWLTVEEVTQYMEGELTAEEVITPFEAPPAAPVAQPSRRRRAA